MDIITIITTLGMIFFSIAYYNVKKKIDLGKDKELEYLRSENIIKNNNLNQLNKEQKLVISVFLKMTGNYYDEEILKNPPKRCGGQYNKKYSQINGGVIEKRVIHAVYELDVELGDKFMNSIAPIVAFNVLLLETASSVNSVKVITYSLNKTYTQDYKNFDFKNPSLYIQSLIYKYLIYDYKKINIPDETLLKFVLNDYDEEINIENFEKIKKDIGIN